MCDPGTIAATAAIAGGIQAYGAIQQGSAESKIARYQQHSAQIAAADAEARGRVEETRFRQQLSQFKGQQRSQIAASGVLLDQGSAAAVLEDTAGFGELDALTIRANAAREAYTSRTQEKAFEYERKQARRRGYLQAAGGLLSTASSVGSGLSSSGVFAKKPPPQTRRI